MAHMYALPMAILAIAAGQPAHSADTVSDLKPPRVVREPPFRNFPTGWMPYDGYNKFTRRADVSCLVSKTAKVTDCEVLPTSTASPSEATVLTGLAKTFTFAPATKNKVAVDGRYVFAFVFDPEGPDTEVQWLRKPQSDQINAMWPSEAAKRGISGQALINCSVGLTGVPTDCKVASETPANMGFGAAALQLTPIFLFRPATLKGYAVVHRVSIPINFIAPPGGGVMIVGKAYQGRTAVPWLAAPTSAEVAAAFPVRAKELTSPGHVVLRCYVEAAGGLKRCQNISEIPMGRGLDKAAKSLIPLFKVDVPLAGVAADSLVIDLPFQFIDPATKAWADRAIAKPLWLTTVNYDAVAQFYPAKALSAGVKSGRGVADCAINASGQLVDCNLVKEEPPGLGFGPAAIRIAGLFVMNRWTGDGLPVDGRRVSMPVRLEAPADQDAKAPAR